MYEKNIVGKTAEGTIYKERNSTTEYWDYHRDDSSQSLLSNLTKEEAIIVAQDIQKDRMIELEKETAALRARRDALKQAIAIVNRPYGICLECQQGVAHCWCEMEKP